MDLQLLAERAFRDIPPNWVAVYFRMGVQSPTIAAKLHAVKTYDPNQLLETATRKFQELLISPISQTSNRLPNPKRPC